MTQINPNSVWIIRSRYDGMTTLRYYGCDALWTREPHEATVFRRYEYASEAMSRLKRGTGETIDIIPLSRLVKRL